MDAATVRVLVVEDNPGDAELITIALIESERPRFHIAHAATFGEALARLQGGAPTDVILLDLSLPDVSGEDTVTRMRSAAPELPIVIMTGFDDGEFAERMVALGAQDYLVKGDSSAPMIWRAIRYAITRMQQAIEREALVKELRDSVEMKNKMFGILAHDLRNPIGAVNGYAEFMELTEELSERMKRSLTAVREAATYMNDLIEDVLSLAVTEAAEVTVIRQRTDLAQVARKAAGVTATAAEKKGIRLALDTRTAWVDGDSLKLEQVLCNLIANAVKFSTPGDAVTVTTRAEGAEARLAVIDRGQGIPEGIRGTLFQPFVKGKTGTAGERSNGLGLYICSRIVAAHGGRIEVDSREGQGTTFTVILPA